MNWKRRHVVLALAALMPVTLPLHANVVLPGDTVSPDVFSNPGAVPLLAQTSGTFSLGSGPGLITGSYSEQVAVDPFGVTCAGCLDFAYQISEDPLLSSGIFSLTLGRFFGYSTDVGYIDGTGFNPCCSGNGDPFSVHRSPLGGTLFFLFSGPSVGEPIGPGGTTAILIVATDATTYDSLGFVGVAGGRADSPTNAPITGLFEPTFQAPVPEPSAAVLLSLGFAGIAAFSRKRRKA